MKIHQMSVSFQPEQDRILMRINTTEREEMRLWLTRRLMVGLWPLMTRMLTEHLLKLEAAGTTLATANPELKKMLADFRKEEFLQGADFDTPYQDQHAAQMPLGEDPLLITDVDATPVPNGPLRLRFNERLPAADRNRSFQIELDPKLMQGLMHLLDHALIQSQWRDSFVPATPEDAGGDADAPGASRRYLN